MRHFNTVGPELYLHCSIYIYMYTRASNTLSTWNSGFPVDIKCMSSGLWFPVAYVTQKPCRLSLTLFCSGTWWGWWLVRLHCLCGRTGDQIGQPTRDPLVSPTKSCCFLGVRKVDLITMLIMWVWIAANFVIRDMAVSYPVLTEITMVHWGQTGSYRGLLEGVDWPRQHHLAVVTSVCIESTFLMWLWVGWGARGRLPWGWWVYLRLWITCRHHITSGLWFSLELNDLESPWRFFRAQISSALWHKWRAACALCLCGQPADQVALVRWLLVGVCESVGECCCATFLQGASNCLVVQCDQVGEGVMWAGTAVLFAFCYYLVPTTQWYFGRIDGGGFGSLCLWGGIDCPAPIWNVTVMSVM